VKREREWVNMTNVVAGAVLGLVTIGAALAAGDASISGESHVNLSEVVSVGVAVCGLVWWLGRKFQAIEDALKEHGRILEKLPCVKGNNSANCAKPKPPNTAGTVGLVALLLASLTLSGCAVTKPLKGGKASTVSKLARGIEQTVVQSDNPAQVSKQDQEVVKVKTYTVPTGSRLEETRVVAPEAGPLVTNVQALVLSAPMPVVEREETRARTELGAAQKDMARELGAKLSSLKGVVWLGVALFLFGLGSLVYPPLKAVIASATTSAAISVGGLALMVLPTLIVGNELLILGGVALAVGAWFLAHRHGQLRGLVDANQNGVDDRVETTVKPGGM
jgi:hypothetical protein